MYPISDSPYFGNPAYYVTRTAMYWLHWPLTILALIASVAVWLPAVSRRLPADALFAARLLSLVMIYFIALHVVVAPYPRYGTPLRPITFGLALFAAATLWARARPASTESADPQTDR